MDNKTTPQISLYTIAQNSEKIKQHIHSERKKEDEILMSFSDLQRKNYLFKKINTSRDFDLCFFVLTIIGKNNRIFI